MILHKRETLLKAAHIGLVIVMLCSLFAVMPASPVKAASYKIIVGDGGEYSTIMAAVANAKPNTVIYVRAGDYPEVINLAQMGLWESGPGNLAIVSMDGPGQAKLHGGSGLAAIHDNNQPFPGSLWIDGMSIDAAVSSAISLTNFNSLMLTNVTIASAGDPDSGDTSTDAISLRVNSGSRTVALLNTNVYNFVRDGLNVQISGSAKANVVIEGGSFKALTDSYKAKAQKAVNINATGTSTTQLTIYKTVFDSLQNAAVSATADSATPVTLTAHISGGAMTNVARTAGTNAVEIRARGAGAHVVKSWFYSNNIFLSNLSDGIKLEPGAPGTFSSILRVNKIETLSGAVSPMAHGIVIDNGPAPAKAATIANFKLEANTVKNAMGSGLDLHMRTSEAATWNGLISNNTFDGVNKATPGNYEGVHFRVQHDGGMPTFTLVFTGNQLLPWSEGLAPNPIKLENMNSTGTFRVVTTEQSSYDEIRSRNKSMMPYIFGAVPPVLNFSGSNVENTRPVTVPDLLIAWATMARRADVVENDTDGNGIFLIYVNPLGEKGGSFWLDTVETPDTQMDDLLVYQAQPGSVVPDKGYYVIQDTLGCLSIGTVNTKIGDPLFLPSLRR